MLILEKRVSRLWMSELLTSIQLIYIGQLYESFTRLYSNISVCNILLEEGCTLIHIVI